MMGEEDRNPEIIRRVDEQLSNVRKEQRVMRLWGGVILGANLLLLCGFLWMLSQGAKQPVPVETGFQFPTPATPAEEDSCVWVADIVPNDRSNIDSVSNSDSTDNVNNTENTDNVDNEDRVDDADMHADTATDNMDETVETNGTNDKDYAEDTEETKDTKNADDADNTEESSLPPVAVAVAPATTRRPVTVRPPAARTVRKAVQPRRKKTVASIPAYIITRPGMTLRSLARLYYGSQVFWVYIYDRNTRVLSSLDTSSFDALPTGIQLELPRPADYGMDATEPISLQRACNRAKSLAKQ